MCPCTPLTSDLFDLDDPLPPGFGGLNSIQLPDINIPFPNLPLDRLQEIFDQLGAMLPSGLTKPSLNPDSLNNVYSAIQDLLKVLYPFLMTYKFLLPILELILCIIEVLCVVPNPFKLIRVMRRLFRVCIPAFLALFPFFALILLILALLLLILALIEYIISRLLQLIETILRNIILLSKAASSLNNDSIIATIAKIGDLLCILQNLFILFSLFNTILQIIQAMAALSFRVPPCDSADGSSDGCCTPDVCPAFIRDNEEITSSTGTFIYTSSLGIDLGLPVPFFQIIRPESWQFYDPNLGINQAFINITHAHDLPPEFEDMVFFPQGATYTQETKKSGAPYYINFKVFYDPAVFGRTDAFGPRYIFIKNAIVQAPPTTGLYNYDGTYIAPFNGTLNLIGGIITEPNGAPLLNEDGQTYTINTFFHRPTNSNGSNPTPLDQIIFNDIEYTFTINHPILVQNNLITIGCVPSVAIERDALAATIGAQFNIKGVQLAGIVNLLPDMNTAQQCVIDAITTYRQSISTESTLKFRETVLNCMNDLRSKTLAAVDETIKAGFDPYKSDFTLDPSIQFTSDTIKIKVSLKDISGNSMTINLPADAASLIALNLNAVLTFGEVGVFNYDGSEFFIAEIISKNEGNGEVKVSYNNSFIGILNNPTDLNQPISTAIKTAQYTFVKSQLLPDSGTPRRDEGDVARE